MFCVFSIIYHLKTYKQECSCPDTNKTVKKQCAPEIQIQSKRQNILATCV